MSRYVIFALAALAACSGPDDKDGSGDTATPGTEECPGGVYTGPVLIVDYSVTCDANDVVTYFVETDGWTANGRVFSQETSNTPAYSDEHDLMSYEYDECQAWDRLDTVLTTGASAPATENVSTVFSCANHFNDPAVMSYAAQVYDLDGNPAHCVAWGDDPQGMIDNTASAGDRTTEPSFPLSGCEIGSGAM
jgi:hypothetical protein